MKKQPTNATKPTETPVAHNCRDKFCVYSCDDFVIFRYSRADALADGVLIDAGQLAHEAGFRYPVALTSAAWHASVAVSPSDTVRDKTGRLCEVLNVLRFSIPAARGISEVEFCVTVWDEHENRLKVELRAVCGPGDNAEPVITVMLPDED